VDSDGEKDGGKKEEEGEKAICSGKLEGKALQPAQQHAPRNGKEGEPRLDCTKGGQKPADEMEEGTPSQPSGNESLHTHTSSFCLHFLTFWRIFRPPKSMFLQTSPQYTIL
jgi:hypothetical protein